MEAQENTKGDGGWFPSRDVPKYKPERHAFNHNSRWLSGKLLEFVVWLTKHFCYKECCTGKKLTDWPTLWSWALLESAPVVQPFDRVPAFNGTRRFVTAFTRALHLYLTWARPIQSTPPSPISTRSILMLSTYLRLFSGLFSSGFPTNNALSLHLFQMIAQKNNVLVIPLGSFSSLDPLKMAYWSPSIPHNYLVAQSQPFIGLKTLRSWRTFLSQALHPPFIKVSPL
jgi:hypothetical protein